MESIIVYPKTKKQQNILKSLLQEMKIYFQIDEEKDDTKLTEEAFFAMVDKAKQQAKEGKVTRLARKDQKAFLGL